MKFVIINAGEGSAVYQVPDAVADSPKKYSAKFMKKSKGEASIESFVDFLNKKAFPGKECRLVEQLPWANKRVDIPEKYLGCRIIVLGDGFMMDDE